jgi:hypothetical protein
MDIRIAMALPAVAAVLMGAAAGTAHAAAPTEQPQTCEQLRVCEVRGEGGLDYTVTFNDVGEPIRVDIMNGTCQPESHEEELGAVICRAIPTTQSGHL